MLDYEQRERETPAILFDHRVEVVLGIGFVDVLSPMDTRFLVVQGKLPSVLVDTGETTLQAAARVLYDLTGYIARIGNVGWVELNQIGVLDNTDRVVAGRRRIAIVYACLLPADAAAVPNAAASWLPITETDSLSNEHRELLSFIMRKV